LPRDDLVRHFDALPHEKRKNAERYIRINPRQVDTVHRRSIERWASFYADNLHGTHMQSQPSIWFLLLIQKTPLSSH
jgi:hypothetical protein